MRNTRLSSQVVSSRKSQANRANARVSTGPKTAAGKAHSARNARRHGLSISALSDPNLSAEIEQMAKHIVGPDTNPELHEKARRIAEAQIELSRVLQTRHRLLSSALSRNDHYPLSEEEFRLLEQATRLVAKPGYPIPPRAEGARKFALVISGLAGELALIDRYERRARSRRKTAVQEFDAVRRRIQQPPPAA